MYNIILLGKYLKYTKSPYIHKLISNDININYLYIIKEIKNINKFKDYFNKLIKNKNILGFNITTPFKEIAYKICDELTYDAKISQSVNTIKIINNKIIGDNTDGKGIIFDFNRLNFINKKNKNILIIGSGGASKAIIPKLYYNNFKIYLTNRTFNKTIDIKKYFNKNNINIEIIKLNKIYNRNFDIIINATSSGIYNEIPEINEKIINENVKIYDLFYNLNEDTPFIKWSKLNNCKFNYDGIGMLISQAAFSSHFWFNKLPNINKIINILKE